MAATNLREAILDVLGMRPPLDRRAVLQELKDLTLAVKAAELNAYRQADEYAGTRASTALQRETLDAEAQNQRAVGNALCKVLGDQSALSQLGFLYKDDDFGPLAEERDAPGHRVSVDVDLRNTAADFAAEAGETGAFWRFIHGAIADEQRFDWRNLAPGQRLVGVHAIPRDVLDFLSEALPYRIQIITRHDGRITVSWLGNNEEA